MAKIGSFHSRGDEIVGEIFSIAVQLQDVRLIKQLSSADHSTPNYAIYAGKAEIGYAVETAETAGHRTLRVNLDDPSFAAPISADLIEGPDATYSLIWSRPGR